MSDGGDLPQVHHRAVPGGGDTWVHIFYCNEYLPDALCSPDSVLIALTALIPVFGAFIGCVVGAVLILVVNPVQAFAFVILFLVLQQVEGNLYIRMLLEIPWASVHLGICRGTDWRKIVWRRWDAGVYPALLSCLCSVSG